MLVFWPRHVLPFDGMSQMETWMATKKKSKVVLFTYMAFFLMTCLVDTLPR
jgi:hypothetical protein